MTKRRKGLVVSSVPFWIYRDAGRPLILSHQETAPGGKQRSKAERKAETLADTAKPRRQLLGMTLRTLVLGLLVAPAVRAQTPASFDSVTLPPAAAKRAMTKAEINGETAERIVKACLDYAKAHNGGASVVVLSPSGFIVHAHRSDGQQPNNVDSAMRKAQTALYLRASTRDGLNRWNNLEAQLVREDIKLYLNPGGFPIVVDDQLIGALGVGGASGGDEQCGYEALTKVLGPQPPMAQARPFGGVGNEPPPAASQTR